jgi:hypothetical protein
MYQFSQAIPALSDDLSHPSPQALDRPSPFSGRPFHKEIMF